MDMEQLKKIYREREPHRAEYGHLINRAVALYEDPTRYDVRQLVDLFMLQHRMMKASDDEDRKGLMEEFEQAIEAVKPLPGAPERIYLYEKDNIPAETDYTENPDYIYDHDPGFEPYYLEMLLPGDVQPKGGIVLVAGGSHGAGSINECYQVGLEFNAMGYQAFILQCRPNGCPWSGLETAADAARAFSLIRAKAGEYRLDPAHLAYAGFSNGGITGDFCIEYFSAGQKIADYFPAYRPDAADDFYGAPDAYICVYGARHKGTEYAEEGVNYPPTFAAIGRLDVVCIDNLFSELLPYLQRHNVPCEVHTFAGHPHGYAGWSIIDGKSDENFDLWVRHAGVFLDDCFDIGRWQKPGI